MGDLDAITLKALAKDPSKRYPSVEQLASDIRRYLNGFPVNARPNTSGYRTRKFIRRHRVGVAIGLIVLTMLTGAAIAYRAEARRATQEATKAEEVKEFLVDMFEAADPWENQDTDISARDLLGRGAEKLEAEFKDNPEIRAELLTTIGTIYRNLGVYEQSDYYLNEALASIPFK